MTMAPRIGVRVLVSLSSEALLESAGTHESGFNVWNIVDKYAPEANIESINVKDTSFILVAEGNDSDSGVVKYEFYINDSLANTINSTEESVSWQVTGKTTGETYTCKVRVHDAAGNWKDSKEISVTPSVNVKIASGVKVGDFVNYDAGLWNSSTDTSKMTSTGGNVDWSGTIIGDSGWFSGIVNGQSRNTNATSYSLDYTSRYSGWRVWSINGDSVTLVSAGCPEMTCHNWENYEIDAYELSDILLARDCSMYENEYAVANSARLMNITDVANWWSSNIESSVTSYWDITWRDMPSIESNPLMSLLDIGMDYTLCNADDSQSIWAWNQDGNGSGRNCIGYLWLGGVRPLITLKSDVMIKGTTGDGTESNPYELVANLSGTDTLAPTTARIAVSNIMSKSFTLTATGVDAAATNGNICSGIKKYEFYIDGKLEKTLITSANSVSWNVEEKNPLTTYTAKVRVFDNADNYTESRIRFTTLQGVVPTVADVQVSNITETSFTVTATGVDDKVGIAKYEFYFYNVLSDGSESFANIHTIETSEGTVTWDVTGLSAYKNYKVKVRVYNTYDNYLEDVVEVKTADTTNPILAKIDIGSLTQTSFTLYAEGRDKDSKVNRFMFYLYNSSGTLIDSYEYYVSGRLGDEYFSATGYWNVIGKTAGQTYKAKVIAYDQENNSLESNVITFTMKSANTGKLASIARVGDYVSYNPGVWTEADLQKITSSYGGLTVDESVRDSSLSLSLSYSKSRNFGGFRLGENKSSGWRIWSIENGIVTLISKLVTERCCIDEESDVQVVSNIFKNRNCSMYVNSYASSSKFVTKSDLDTWYNKNIDSSVTNLFPVGDYDNQKRFNKIKDENYDTLLSVINIGSSSYYWLGDVYDEDNVYYCSGDYVSDQWILQGRVYGLRPLVVLKTSINAISGDGTESNPWVIN